MSRHLLPSPRLGVLPVLLLGILAAPGLRADEPLRVQPQLRTGERFTLEIVTTRDQAQPRRFRGRGLNLVDVEVREAGPAGYVLRWTLRDARSLDPGMARDPTVKAMVEVVRGVTVEFVLTPEGAVGSVRNFDEVKAVLDRALAKLLPALPVRDAAERAQIERLMRQFMGSQQMVEQAFLKEARMYFAAMFALRGHALTREQPLEYETELPLPFGGVTVPAKGRVTLESVDARTGSVTIGWRQEMDGATAKAALERLAAEMAKQMDEPAPGPGQTPKLDLRDETRFVMDPKTGRVEHLRHRRTISTRQGDRVQGVEITRQDAPAASQPGK